MSVPIEVRLLAKAWDTWQHDPTFPFRPDHCINGTRVGIHVLRNVGVEAKPVAVEFAILNRFAAELYLGGVPVGDWPEHAYSIGARSDHEPAEGGWAGHLMIEGEDWVMDLSARQFHRPGKIDCPGPIVLAGALEANNAWVDDHQQVLVIRRDPANNAWRGASGWKMTTTNSAAVAVMTFALQNMLGIIEGADDG